MDIKLEELNAWQIGSLVNKLEISPVKVIEYFLDRIEKRNKDINAFVYVKRDYALQKAKELEARLNKGEYCGPFAGVPFGLKDFLPNKKGWQSSHGGVKCLVAVDEYDSVFCQAMEKAGGIAIGKTNAPAYGFRGTTDNKMYGATSTPFNTKYNSGGSSGGSAAAVADGLVPISEGGDAGGSIRLPACFCNLFGYKAGVGSIPSVCRPDAWSATHPLCFNGAVTKCVKDTAILMNYMCHEDKRDPFSLPTCVDFTREIEQETKKLKIAFTADFGIFDIEDEVREHITAAAYKFREAGFSVDEVKFNFKHTANELSEQWCKGITVDCALDLNHLKEHGTDLLKDNKNDFPEEFIYWKQIVDKMGIEDFYQYNLAATDVLDQFENVFEQYDLIVSPICNVTGILNKDDRNTKGPETINGRPVESLIGWTQTFLANFTGNPACSVPAGLTKNGIPIGMQIIGKRHQDAVVLKAARVYEDHFPWNEYYNIPLNRKVN